MTRVIHVTVGNSDWTPTNKQLETVKELFTSADLEATVIVTRDGIVAKELNDEEAVVTHYLDKLEELNMPISLAIKAKIEKIDLGKLLENADKDPVGAVFCSTDDKRLESNTFPDKLEPDDVSYNYRLLDDEEKNNMKEVKILAQNLINKIRTCGSGKHIEEAIKCATLASIWATKEITGPK